jgi:hypothetical protein
MKKLLRSMLGEDSYFRLKRYYYRNSLPELAMLYGTDKWGLHKYASRYQSHFWHLKNSKFNLLEIGVGGHEDPTKGGKSLRMWKAFFPKANIYAIDIHDKHLLNENRIKIYQGSQADPKFLDYVLAAIGEIKIVIDDGSHINNHVITSFEHIFPKLPESAIYAIEDLQTAYWDEFGGSSDTPATNTSMAMLKALVDGLNWEEILDRSPAQFDKIISSISFYHNLSFILKGCNEEGTNKDSPQIVG